jgi:mercuric ion transport protein
MNSNSSAVKPDGIFTKQRVGLAGVAAVAACAACCSIPMLVAAGIGGGALTTIASYLAPGAELVAGGVVAAAVVGVAAVRSRRRASGCGEVCTVPGAENGDLSDGAGAAGTCGCAPAGRGASSVYESAKPRPGEPIVCTADLADTPTVQGQIDGYRAAFVHLVRTERFAGGSRWVFRKEPGLRERLVELAQGEHQCCKFFQFDVKDTSEHLVWETRADDAAASVLEFYSQMPERLREEPRRGADTAALKLSATTAGLKFAADERCCR